MLPGMAVVPGDPGARQAVQARYGRVDVWQEAAKPEAVGSEWSVKMNKEFGGIGNLLGPLGNLGGVLGARSLGTSGFDGLQNAHMSLADAWNSCGSGIIAAAAAHSRLTELCNGYPGQLHYYKSVSYVDPDRRRAEQEVNAVFSDYPGAGIELPFPEAGLP